MLPLLFFLSLAESDVPTEYIETPTASTKPTDEPLMGTTGYIIFCCVIIIGGIVAIYYLCRYFRCVRRFTEDNDNRYEREGPRGGSPGYPGNIDAGYA